MWKDPEIRSYAESAPAVPDLSGKRYRWPDHGDPDVELVRRYMQEGGRGMFVLRSPEGDWKALVEAYYPEGIRPTYARTFLGAPQRSDYQEGRLVVVKELKRFLGHLTEADLLEYRENNRNARRDLKRTRPDSYHKQALENEVEHEADWLDDLADEAGGEFGEGIHFASTPKSFIPKQIGGGSDA